MSYDIFINYLSPSARLVAFATTLSDAHQLALDYANRNGCLCWLVAGTGSTARVTVIG